MPRCKSFSGRLHAGLTAACLCTTAPLLATTETGGNLIVDVESAENVVAVEMLEQTGYRRHGDSNLISAKYEGASVELRIELEHPGHYRLHAWWPDVSRSSDSQLARYEIKDDSEASGDIVLDQAHFAGQWNLLGDFSYSSAKDAIIRVSGAEGETFTVDAFRLEYLGLEPAVAEIVTTALPIAYPGGLYHAKIEGRGGSTRYDWAISGALPEGLSFEPALGIIAGRPKQSGTFAVEFYLHDDEGQSASRALELHVSSEPSSGEDRSVNEPQSSYQPRSGLDRPQAAPAPSLIELVTAMPEGSWKQLNANQFSDVWTPAELRPLYRVANPTPMNIIEAWSSFAWDTLAGDLILYGGGHANYPGNDIYIWRGETRLWERASLPSEVVRDAMDNWQAIDGVFAAPSSAHTYDNNVYLPMADRFMTYGGAVFNSGSAYELALDANTERQTGPYVFNQNLANSMQVGGRTGSHVQREGAFAEIIGGNMWQNRDVHGHFPASANIPLRHTAGTTSVRVENGRDVVYLTARPNLGGTAQHLYRHTIHDINDPSRDTWEKVGRYSEGFAGQGAGAYATDAQAYVRTSKTKFLYWDMTLPGPSNNNAIFVPTDATGEFELTENHGMDYYPPTRALYLWEGFADVWRLDPPELMGKSGWTLTKEIPSGTEFPDIEVRRGVLGKWKYAADINAFIGLQGIEEGNVWVYKPVGWQPPVAQNFRPTAVFSNPTAQAIYQAGDSIAIEVLASDNDGDVVLVEFYADGELIGQKTTPPYTLNYTPTATGSISLSATAVDNNGASGSANPVVVQIFYDSEPPQVALSSPANNSSYTEGDSLQFLATASDIDGSVNRVEFLIDSVLMGTDITSPYTFDWTVTGLGLHQIQARAVDDGGQIAITPETLVTVVARNLLPSAVLTEPTEGAQYEEGDDITLIASAQDDDGDVVWVEFFANGSKIGEAVTQPFSMLWEAVTPGSYTLTARATDNAGDSKTSEEVIVTVTADDGSLSITLQDGLDGYGGTRDTYLYSYHETKNFGASTQLRDRASRMHTLVGFTIFQSQGGPLPDGALIQSAVLSLYKSSNYDHSYAAHRLQAQWVEDEASWAQASAGIPWQQAGADGSGSDFRTSADGSGSIGWSPGWVDIDVTSGVQEFSFGGTNAGWRIVSLGGTSNIKKFHSREADNGLSPRLTIRYTLNGEIPPTVTLDTPVNGASFVEGSPVNLTAQADDFDGSVERVEFYVDGISVATDFTAPYEHSWIAPAPGDYSISARAFDNAGNQANTATALVYVASDNVGPTVSQSAPAAGAEYTLGDTILIEVNAADGDGSVSEVAFFANGALLGIDESAPYSFSWSGAQLGVHTLTSQATDNEGAVTESAGVPVSVLGNDGTVTVILQEGLNGYTGSADTYLTSWKKDKNYGASVQLRDQADKYVSLLRFPLFQSEGGHVPDGAIIDSASLSLYKISNYDHQYSAHRMLVPWTEDGATWNQTQAGVSWAQPGAEGNGTDYIEIADGNGSIDWSPGWIEIDVTAGVSAMGAGQTNFGWLIRGLSGAGNLKKFESREGSQVFRPKLTVTYH